MDRQKRLELIIRAETAGESIGVPFYVARYDARRSGVLDVVFDWLARVPEVRTAEFMYDSRSGVLVLPWRLLVIIGVPSSANVSQVRMFSTRGEAALNAVIEAAQGVFHLRAYLREVDARQSNQKGS